MWTVAAFARLRAATFGVYPSSLIASCTRCMVSALTFASPLMTRDTVIGETPTCFATSCMVTAFRLRLGVLFTTYLSSVPAILV